MLWASCYSLVGVYQLLEAVLVLNLKSSATAGLVA